MAEYPTEKNRVNGVDVQDQICEILLLRTIVATLGEREEPPWWRTQFLTDVGLRTLSRVFPRTAAGSGLNSVVVIARREHDKRIGHGKRYHLFRLPENLERAVADLMSQQLFSKQMQGLALHGHGDLISRLAGMAAGCKVGPAEGPIGLGSRANIAEPAGIQAMAAHYRNSFDSGRRAFPYFTEFGERI